MDSLYSFNALCRQTGVSLKAVDDVSVLAEPVRSGDLQMPNSLAVHPMEGADGDTEGRPGPLTFRRYERFAAGGAGLIWAEAIAVVPEGRANPRQLWLHEGSKAALGQLVRRMRHAAAASMGPGHRPVLVAQLTHSGRYSKPDGTPKPIIPQRDPYRDPMTPEPEPSGDRPSRIASDMPLVTDAYLDNLQTAYVQAAQMAFEAGFDAVDIKACHGYLVHELLAARNRAGRYGGDFENRTRFLLAVIEKVQKVCKPGQAVVSRLNCYDAIPYPYGWGVDKDDYTQADLAEPQRLVRLMNERGVSLINFTIANPYYNPHFGRPFNQPIREGYPEPEHPLKGVERLVTLAGKMQKAFPEIAFVGTGYSWLRQWMGNVAAAVKADGLIRIVGAGRMAFAYPDFAKDLLTEGTLDKKKICVACSACTQLMRDGSMAGCVVRDHKIYGPLYRLARRSDKGHLQALSQNCLGCLDATCQTACPAGIDIPEFIRLFQEGDERGAYEVIRRANILPEVCAWLCPVEQQCEGACLQYSLGKQALPIADIQRYLASQANAYGWSKLRIPDTFTGKRVAVVGAGPAGLAATAVLLEAGHQVTLFDRCGTMGGMIESVIPPSRQQSALRHELSGLFDDVPGDRLVLRLGRGLDKRFTLDDMMAEGYQAVFLGMGLSEAMCSTTQTAEGLYDALSFLNLARERRLPDVTNKRVAVIGGGNTAMDAAVSAIDLGAQDVYLLYRRSFSEMPAWASERERAIEAGVHFLVLTQQLDYKIKDGVLTGVCVCPCRLTGADTDGRRRPEPDRDNAYGLDVNVVVEAIGQRVPAELISVLPGVVFKDGVVQTRPDSLMTSRENVYAGGDLVSGPKTVVAAVAAGMAAGRQIDRQLQTAVQTSNINRKYSIQE